MDNRQLRHSRRESVRGTHGRGAKPGQGLREDRDDPARHQQRRGHPRLGAGSLTLEKLLKERLASVYGASRWAAIPELRPVVDAFYDRIAVEVPSNLLLPHSERPP